MSRTSISPARRNWCEPGSKAIGLLSRARSSIAGATRSMFSRRLVFRLIGCASAASIGALLPRSALGGGPLSGIILRKGYRDATEAEMQAALEALARIPVPQFIPVKPEIYRAF